MSTLKVNALQDTNGNGFYPARHWVNFNGTGTISIRDSGGNVSSLTDVGTGNYKVNLSSLGSINYALTIGTDYNSAFNDNNATTGIIDGTSTTAFGITAYGIATATKYDSYHISAIIVMD